MGEAHAGDWVFRLLLVGVTVVGALARPSYALIFVPVMMIGLWMNFMWPRRTKATVLGSVVFVLAILLLGSELAGV